MMKKKNRFLDCARNDPAPNYGKRLFGTGQARDNGRRAVSVTFAALFCWYGFNMKYPAKKTQKTLFSGRLQNNLLELTVNNL
jgi:hypothetical protein